MQTKPSVQPTCHGGRQGCEWHTDYDTGTNWQVTPDASLHGCRHGDPLSTAGQQEKGLATGEMDGQQD